MVGVQVDYSMNMAVITVFSEWNETIQKVKL